MRKNKHYITYRPISQKLMISVNKTVPRLADLIGIKKVDGKLQ